MKKITGLLILFGLISITTWSVVMAHSAHFNKSARSANSSFKFRTATMQIYKWYLSPMGAMVKGKTDFNAKAFTRDAEGLAVVSQLGLLEGFPKDSSENEIDDSDAKSDIWENWEDFEKKFTLFQEEVKQLVKVAQSGNEEAMKSQFVKTSKTCGGCHKPYRNQ